jgi:hypothetical protein
LEFQFIIKNVREKLHQEIYKTPIEKATSLLDTLRERIAKKVKSKPIIANLRIARNYIEEAIEIPAMESTHFRTDSRIENRIGKEKMTLSGNY